MAHDTPDVPELVRTAHEFITTITQKLDGQDRYYALCVAYLLEIAQRELREWAPLETEDDRRLRALLDDDVLPAERLTAELSVAIRTGKFDNNMDELLNELIAHVESKVAVSKPSHLGELGVD